MGSIAGLPRTSTGAIDPSVFPTIPILADPAAGSGTTPGSLSPFGASAGSSVTPMTFAQAVAANPLFAFAIVGVALLALASIPATSGAAVWIAAVIFLLQILALVAHKQGAS